MALIFKIAVDRNILLLRYRAKGAYDTLPYLAAINVASYGGGVIIELRKVKKLLRRSGKALRLVLYIGNELPRGIFIDIRILKYAVA
jgi:hypothetical protein